MHMPTIVRKWGNSLGIRLPKSVAEQVRLDEGSEVEFDTSGGILTVRIKRKPRYKLADLLAKAKGPSPHRRVADDGPVGRELL
jgi:antitoxin MazE